MKVVFTAHAVSRLRQILAFIAADSPANAVSMVERIIARAETLDTQSFRGRRVPGYPQDNVREILEPPYRIIYRVTGNAVQVLSGAKNTLATKNDLVVLRAELRGEMAALGAALRTEIAKQGGELRAEIGGVARQMYVALLGQTAVLLGFFYLEEADSLRLQNAT